MLLVKKSLIVKVASVLVGLLVISSCANTQVTKNWLQEASLSYQHPMIVAIVDSQQTRQVYEKHFTSQLKELNVNATPSYKKINSKQSFTKETITNVLDGSNIDSVLITYLIADDTDVDAQDSPLGMTYTGDIKENIISDTLVSTRGRPNSDEVIVLKTDLYDPSSQSIVWSTQTKTTGPKSIDEVIANVSGLLVQQLINDGMLQ